MLFSNGIQCYNQTCQGSIQNRNKPGDRCIQAAQGLCNQNLFRRQRSQFLYAVGVQGLSLYKASLYLKARILLCISRKNLRTGNIILCVCRNSGCSFQNTVQAFQTRVIQRTLQQRILNNLVLAAGLSQLLRSFVSSATVIPL